MSTTAILVTCAVLLPKLSLAQLQDTNLTNNPPKIVFLSARGCKRSIQSQRTSLVRNSNPRKPVLSPCTVHCTAYHAVHPTRSSFLGAIWSCSDRQDVTQCRLSSWSQLGRSDGAEQSDRPLSGPPKLQGQDSKTENWAVVVTVLGVLVIPRWCGARPSYEGGM